MPVNKSIRVWNMATALLLLGIVILFAVQVQIERHRRGIERRLGHIEDRVVHHASANGLPVELVRCVIRAESGGDPRAHSDKNAKGLMQITPPAEEDALRKLEIPKGDLFDPDYNLAIGCAYLKMLHDRFDGDLHLVIAAYHMGQTRVAKLRRENPGVPSRKLVEKFAGPKTRAYTRRVVREYEVEQLLADRENA